MWRSLLRRKFATFRSTLCKSISVSPMPLSGIFIRAGKAQSGTAAAAAAADESVTVSHTRPLPFRKYHARPRDIAHATFNITNTCNRPHCGNQSFMAGLGVRAKFSLIISTFCCIVKHAGARYIFISRERRTTNFQLQIPISGAIAAGRNARFYRPS